MQTVDHYQMTERAVKYGLLFVILTFTVFLLWELLRNLRLHPVQYLLIGAALVVFYLLLLSLAEHMPFAGAYGIAAAATIALVAGYAASVLSAGLRGAVGIGGWLTALYGVLFVLLQLEDVALLVGSVFVFLMLALVVYLTRRIDWSGGRVPSPYNAALMRALWLAVALAGVAAGTIHGRAPDRGRPAPTRRWRRASASSSTRPSPPSSCRARWSSSATASASWSARRSGRGPRCRRARRCRSTRLRRRLAHQGGRDRRPASCSSSKRDGCGWSIRCRATFPASSVTASATSPSATC